MVNKTIRFILKQPGKNIVDEMRMEGTTTRKYQSKNGICKIASEW